jgi:hypothetical protein
MGDPEGRGLGTPAATGNGLTVRPEPPGVWGRSGYDDGSPLDKWDHRPSPKRRASAAASPSRKRAVRSRGVVEDGFNRVAQALDKLHQLGLRAAADATRSRADCG